MGPTYSAIVTILVLWFILDIYDLMHNFYQVSPSYKGGLQCLARLSPNKLIRTPEKPLKVSNLTLLYYF